MLTRCASVETNTRKALLDEQVYPPSSCLSMEIDVAASASAMKALCGGSAGLPVMVVSAQDVLTVHSSS